MKHNILFLTCLMTSMVFFQVQATELTDAAAQGNTKKVQALLKSGANINEQDKKGLTPIMHAVKNKHSGIVSLLMQNGADDTIQDASGKTVDDYWRNMKNAREQNAINRIFVAKYQKTSSN